MSEENRNWQHCQLSVVNSSFQRLTFFRRCVLALLHLLQLYYLLIICQCLSFSNSFFVSTAIVNEYIICCFRVLTLSGENKNLGNYIVQASSI